MAPPRDTAETVQRLHAAITALDPDLAPPLPEDPTDEDAAALLGILTAHTDNILYSQPVERINITAHTYNHVLGNRREEEEGGPTSLTYERFAARLQLTGVALMTTTGRGPATMMTGCLLAAFEGAQVGAAFAEYFARPEEERGSHVSLQKRERLNKRLVTAQEHLAMARNGIAMMAGYPEGVPNPEDVGTVLESQDPRITKIIDMGGSAHIEYSFPTPDGSRRMTGSLPLDGVAELVGLEAEERHAEVVRMIEESVDLVESDGLQAPPG